MGPGRTSEILRAVEFSQRVCEVGCMSSDCLFCKIVAGSIPAKRVYEDELCLCFADIHPQAPTHLLIIPKEHIASQAHAEETHAALLGHLMATAASIARSSGLDHGYRVVINT